MALKHLSILGLAFACLLAFILPSCSGDSQISHKEWNAGEPNKKTGNLNEKKDKTFNKRRNRKEKKIQKNKKKQQNKKEKEMENQYTKKYRNKSVKAPRMVSNSLGEGKEDRNDRVVSKGEEIKKRVRRLATWQRPNINTHEYYGYLQSPFGWGSDTYSSTDGCSLEKNTLLTVLPQLKKEFSISFEFQAREYMSGWQSVIHLTEEGNCCEVGQRIPALWVKDGGQLHPCFAVDGNGNYYTLTHKKYSLSEWHHVQFSQSLKNGKYMYRVVIDGETVLGPVENRRPESFSNVKVYAADPWYNSLKGSIRNLIIITDSTNGWEGFCHHDKENIEAASRKTIKFFKGIKEWKVCSVHCLIDSECIAWVLNKKQEKCIILKSYKKILQNKKNFKWGPRDCG